MRGRSHLFGLFCAALAVAGGTGCAMELPYHRPAAAPTLIGQAHVVVDDQRAQDQGGDDPLEVGIVRNTYGMPFRVKSEDDRAPVRVIGELVQDCLRAAGFAEAEPPAFAPQVTVHLLELWADGYEHYRANLRLRVDLQRDVSSQPVWSHTVELNEGTTLMWSMGELDEAFEKVLDGAVRDLVDAFARPAFRDQQRALAAPP